MSKEFSLGSRIRSISHALRGIGILIRSQHNAWIHLFATALVVLLGIGLGVTRIEWCLLVIAIMVVWVAEGLNTSLELLADYCSSEHDPLIGRAKDVAAGAVLLAAMGAVAVGAFVFLPHLFGGV